MLKLCSKKISFILRVNLTNARLMLKRNHKKQCRIDFPTCHLQIPQKKNVIYNIPHILILWHYNPQVLHIITCVSLCNTWWNKIVQCLYVTLWMLSVRSTWGWRQKANETRSKFLELYYINNHNFITSTSSLINEYHQW